MIEENPFEITFLKFPDNLGFSYVFSSFFENYLNICMFGFFMPRENVLWYSNFGRVFMIQLAKISCWFLPIECFILEKNHFLSF